MLRFKVREQYNIYYFTTETLSPRRGHVMVRAQSSELVLPIRRQQRLQPIQGEGPLASGPMGSALARSIDPDIDREVEAVCSVRLGENMVVHALWQVEAVPRLHGAGGRSRLRVGVAGEAEQVGRGAWLGLGLVLGLRAQG